MKNAILWIRDGVLVNRMHVNAAAFAFSAWCFSKTDTRGEICFEDLINFAFQKSGLSCADKLRLLNVECRPMVEFVDPAARFYNSLAAHAGEHCKFFEGAPNLLRDLQNAGNSNFITSAVEQEVLDLWRGSPQGSVVSGFLHEILGHRQNFEKGPDHFRFVSRELGHERLFMIADAPAEIILGHRYAKEFDITLIGFANLVVAADICDAFEIVGAALDSCKREHDMFSDPPAAVNPERVVLPNRAELENTLSRVGAHRIVGGTREEIMGNLRSCLQQLRLLVD